MTVKESARRQYGELVNKAARQFTNFQKPSEGWIANVRKALAMKGVQLAKRTSVTRAAISQAERNERDGAITLKQMEKIANALECKFVYAIVPEGKVEDILARQACKKANKIMTSASAHMALEDQSLPSSATAREIDRLVSSMLNEISPGLWDE